MSSQSRSGVDKDSLNPKFLYAEVVRRYERGEFNLDTLITYSVRISSAAKLAGVPDPGILSVFTEFTNDVMKSRENPKHIRELGVQIRRWLASDSSLLDDKEHSQTNANNDTSQRNERSIVDHLHAPIVSKLDVADTKLIVSFSELDKRESPRPSVAAPSKSKSCFQRGFLLSANKKPSKETISEKIPSESIEDNVRVPDKNETSRLILTTPSESKPSFRRGFLLSTDNKFSKERFTVDDLYAPTASKLDVTDTKSIMSVSELDKQDNVHALDENKSSRPILTTPSESEPSFRRGFLLSADNKFSKEIVSKKKKKISSELHDPSVVIIGDDCAVSDSLEIEGAKLEMTFSEKYSNEHDGAIRERQDTYSSSEYDLSPRVCKAVVPVDLDSRSVSFKFEQSKRDLSWLFESRLQDPSFGMISFIEENFLKPLADIPENKSTQSSSFNPTPSKESCDLIDNMMQIEKFYRSQVLDMHIDIATTNHVSHLKPPDYWPIVDKITSLVSEYPLNVQTIDLDFNADTIITSFVVTLDGSYDRDKCIRIYTTYSDMIDKIHDPVERLYISQRHISLLLDELRTTLLNRSDSVIHFDDDNTLTKRFSKRSYYANKMLKRNVAEHIRVFSTFHHHNDNAKIGRQITVYKARYNQISGLSYPGYNVKGFAIKYNYIVNSSTSDVRLSDVLDVTNAMNFDLTSEIYKSSRKT